MSPAAKYGDPLHRPRRAQLMMSKSDFLDPGGSWEPGFCQTLLASTWDAAAKIEPDDWHDLVPDWLAYPWLTFVVGSGALSVPVGFAARLRQLPERWEGHAQAILKNDDWPRGKPRPLEVGSRIADAEEFLDELIATRLRLRATELLEQVNPVELPAISEFTTALILTVSTLTRTYHELSIALNTPLDHWGRDIARAGTNKPSERRRAMRDWTDVRAFIGYLRRELDADADSWARQTSIGAEVREKPFEAGEASSLRSLLDEIEEQFEFDVHIEAEHIRMLTALVWHRLCKELSPTHYPGWTDLLMRLVLQNERAQLSHRQPRWSKIGELNTWVSEMIVPAAGSTWVDSADSPRTELDAEVQSFYDSLGESLWAQARTAASYHQPARSPVIFHDGVAFEPLRAPQGLPLATAYVTSFDMELERSLWRTVGRANGATSGSFSIVFPAYLQKSAGSSDGEFYWLEKVVTVDVLRDPDGAFWFRDTSNRGDGPPPKLRIMHSRRRDLHGHPYVVRLGGCPVVNLPTLEEMAADPDFLADFRELNDGRNPEPRGLFVHSLTVDEYLALRQVETEQVWRTMKDQQSRTLPELMRLSVPDGPTRYWALLGIQLRDPAVRLRLLSLFNYKFSSQASSSKEVGVEPTGTSSSGQLPPEEPGSEVAAQANPIAKNGLPDPPKLCGLAVNVRYDDDELVLLDSLNLTAVEDRAQALATEFRHYAHHLNDYLATRNEPGGWHRPGRAGCEPDRGRSAR